MGFAAREDPAPDPSALQGANDCECPAPAVLRLRPLLCGRKRENSGEGRRAFFGAPTLLFISFWLDLPGLESVAAHRPASLTGERSTPSRAKA